MSNATQNDLLAVVCILSGIGTLGFMVLCIVTCHLRAGCLRFEHRLKRAYLRDIHLCMLFTCVALLGFLGSLITLATR